VRHARRPSVAEVWAGAGGVRPRRGRPHRSRGAGRDA
jgi:hypothetical protein